MLETFHLANSVPSWVKRLALSGLIFIVLEYGFIWFNFYLDFVMQNFIKKPSSSLVTAQIFTKLKVTHTQVHLEVAVLVVVEVVIFRSSCPEMFCQKKAFLEISQNSQENICARVSFSNKVAGQACKLY